jgi:hypothetical protein
MGFSIQEDFGNKYDTIAIQKLMKYYPNLKLNSK